MGYARVFVENYIATIVIDRQEARNALNWDALNELEFIFDSLTHQDIRCCLVCSADPRSFVAGADIAEMSAFNKCNAHQYSQKGSTVFEKISKVPFPTIAVIDGYALGGGCELALACDIRVCSNRAIFGQPETGLGIIPGFGGTQRLARLVGISKAKQIIFTAKMINADEALNIGLVDEVYNETEIDIRAKELATCIVENAPIAVQVAKKVIDSGIEKSLIDALKTETEEFANTFKTKDREEGFSAFLERRKHKPFTGC